MADILATETSPLPEGFIYLADVDGSILQDVRYAGYNNFVGCPVTGYEAEKIVTTVEVAQALKAVQADLVKNTNGMLTLIVFDAYRPQIAVDHFVAWSEDPEDLKMKAEYYPHIPDKTKLFEMGYIARRSSHSRGSAVDLSLAVSGTDPVELVPMGSNFDVLDPISSYDYPDISENSKGNRRLLREIMLTHGFEPYDKEWWHFRYIAEPFPDQYFAFPVR